MIDYDKKDDDPIVAEVRRAREQMLAEHSYDLRALFNHMRQAQLTNGRKYATHKPRHVSHAKRKAG